MPADEKSVKAFTSVPIFNIVVFCQIKDLLQNCKRDNIPSAELYFFSVQMNGSTDMAGLAHLLYSSGMGTN